MESTSATAELGAHDVVMGRGSAATDYQGNVRLRLIVSERQEEYARCERRSDKHRIAKEIMSAVQRDGGRFLQRRETSSSEVCNGSSNSSSNGGMPLHASNWEEVKNLPLLLNKIKQLLREATPEARQRRRTRRHEKMEAKLEAKLETKMKVTSGGTTPAISVKTATTAHVTQPLQTRPTRSTDTVEALARAILPAVTQQQHENLQRVHHLIQTLQAQVVAENVNPAMQSLPTLSSQPGVQNLSNVNLQVILYSALLTSCANSTMNAVAQHQMHQPPAVAATGNSQHDLVQFLVSALKGSS